MVPANIARPLPKLLHFREANQRRKDLQLGKFQTPIPYPTKSDAGRRSDQGYQRPYRRTQGRKGRKRCCNFDDVNEGKEIPRIILLRIRYDGEDRGVVADSVQRVHHDKKCATLDKIKSNWLSSHYCWKVTSLLIIIGRKFLILGILLCLHIRLELLQGLLCLALVTLIGSKARLLTRRWVLWEFIWAGWRQDAIAVDERVGNLTYCLMVCEAHDKTVLGTLVLVLRLTIEQWL